MPIILHILLKGTPIQKRTRNITNPERILRRTGHFPPLVLLASPIVPGSLGYKMNQILSQKFQCDAFIYILEVINNLLIY